MSYAIILLGWRYDKLHVAQPSYSLSKLYLELMANYEGHYVLLKCLIFQNKNIAKTTLRNQASSTPFAFEYDAFL